MFVVGACTRKLGLVGTATSGTKSVSGSCPTKASLRLTEVYGSRFFTRDDCSTESTKCGVSAEAPPSAYLYPQSWVSKS
jgi:hypothetical protein